jgi:dimethylargininase
MLHPCYQFTRAITRAPSQSIIHGLRAIDTGAPDLARMQVAHQHYIMTLREAGLNVTELPALEQFPDSVFVEDAALCLPQAAILLRPGAPSRIGEVAEMASTLKSLSPQVLTIAGSGFIDGGDILLCDQEILIGRSNRTDAAGIAELTQLLSAWNFSVREVHTPPGVLHFKTDCALLDAQTILSTERLAATRCFEGYRVILTSPGEEAAANAIRCNQLVLMAAGFPGTRARLGDAGFQVRELDNSEFAKLDGGMSCLSLRF